MLLSLQCELVRNGLSYLAASQATYKITKSVLHQSGAYSNVMTNAILGMQHLCQRCFMLLQCMGLITHIRLQDQSLQKRI